MILPQSPEVKEYLRLVSWLSIKRAFKGIKSVMEEEIGGTCHAHVPETSCKGLFEG